MLDARSSRPSTACSSASSISISPTLAPAGACAPGSRPSSSPSISASGSISSSNANPSHSQPSLPPNNVHQASLARERGRRLDGSPPLGERGRRTGDKPPCYGSHLPRPGCSPLPRQGEGLGVRATLGSAPCCGGRSNQRVGEHEVRRRDADREQEDHHPPDRVVL